VRAALVRWGDSISARVDTPLPPPGSLIAGPRDLVAIPRMTGAGSPRVWILNSSVLAPLDPAVPTWVLRILAYLGVGSTARQAVREVPFVGSNFPIDIPPITFGASEVRISAELLLGASSPLPSVIPSVIQAWVTCAPYSPYSQTETLP